MTSIGYSGPHTVLALVFRRDCHYKFRIDPVMDLLWAAGIKTHSMLINKKLKLDHKKNLSRLKIEISKRSNEMSGKKGASGSQRW